MLLMTYDRDTIYVPMTLTTHAIVGAAAAELFPAHPFWGFCAGFISHFLVDAIPHGHYRLYSKTSNKDDFTKEDMRISPVFLYDLARIGFDFLVGVSAVALFFILSLGHLPLAALTGALGGVLPDPLKFAYWKIRREPLTLLQRFHFSLDARYSLDDKPSKAVAIELTIIVIALIVTARAFL